MSKKNIIENTTARAIENRNPFGFYGEAQLMGPRGIEAQESRGQRQLVASEVLPTDGLDDTYWQAVGIKIGNRVAGDPIFTEVELPAGWTKAPTDHSMWSSLLDEKGRKRGNVFYKAAFYDRSARISRNNRFHVQPLYNAHEPQRTLTQIVKMDDREIYRTSTVDDPVYNGREVRSNAHTDSLWRKREEIERSQIDECVRWLDENYPLHADPIRQWETP